MQVPKRRDEIPTEGHSIEKELFQVKHQELVPTQCLEFGNHGNGKWNGSDAEGLDLADLRNGTKTGREEGKERSAPDTVLAGLQKALHSTCIIIFHSQNNHAGY